MSDVMLHGVLNMPPNLWSDSPIDIAQRHGRYVEASKRIKELENELSEARKQCDEWDRIAHEKLSELAVQIDRANRAEHQRDMLAEVLIKCRKYLNEEIDSLPFSVIDKALDAVKGTSR
jgi:hypothetical protein